MSYLRLQTPKENKSNIIGFLLLFLYLFGIIPIIGDPFSIPFFIAAIIPVAIIQIWAFLYIIDPYKYEKSYYLFWGIYGVVNTFIYFLAIQKILYVNLGAKGIWPLLFGALLLILLLFVVNWMNWKALYTGTYYKLQQKSSVTVGWLAVGGTGYVLSQLILSFIYTDSALSILIIVFLSFFSIITAFFSIYIHRYFFIRKNLEFVKQVYPNFGLPKNERYIKRKSNR